LELYLSPDSNFSLIHFMSCLLQLLSFPKCPCLAHYQTCVRSFDYFGNPFLCWHLWIKSTIHIQICFKAILCLFLSGMCRSSIKMFNFLLKKMNVHAANFHFL
jgi:hypothetical protein